MVEEEEVVVVERAGQRADAGERESHYCARTGPRAGSNLVQGPTAAVEWEEEASEAQRNRC